MLQTFSKAHKPSLVKPKKQWKRVPFKVAKKINKNRTRKVDEDELGDEDTVMLSLAGLDEDELFVCYAEIDSDDSQANYAMVVPAKEPREEKPDCNEAAFNCKYAPKNCKITYIADSGPTDHLCNDISALINIRKLANPK
uniref:Glutamate 5-kinase n=1 Tax=Lygus hesperus TaxID=30085 RepID=A0A0A9W236_LYGHE